MGISLDGNATVAPEPKLFARLADLLSTAGNPSSPHLAGQRARYLIEEARRSLGRFLDVAPDDRIIFCSGATEANSTIFSSVVRSSSHTAPIVTSRLEHDSVYESARFWESQGRGVVWVPHEHDGTVRLSSLTSSAPTTTALVSLMLANNETGVAGPLIDYGAVMKLREAVPQAHIHADGSQWIGKRPFSFRRSNLDSVTCSPHKWGALPGVGVLVVREGVSVLPLIHGGPQELRVRPGTENLPGIVAAALVADELVGTLPAREAAMERGRTELLTSLREAFPAMQIIGEVAHRLPNTFMARFPGVRADDLIVACDGEGVRVASGAACASGKPDPSRVVLELGCAPHEAREFLRFSLPPNLSQEEIRRAGNAVIRVVRHALESRRAA